MRKLALDDDILLNIEKPARYIGGEVNAVMKEKELEAGEIAVRFAMCFPDVYEIGMSHLGIQILYDMFNRREDVWCERVYSPWMDLDKIMREQDLPLFTLESQDPVRSFDFLGITIQFEMCYCGHRAGGCRRALYRRQRESGGHPHLQGRPHRPRHPLCGQHPQPQL